MIATATLLTALKVASVVMSVVSLAATAYMAFTAPGPQEGPKIGDTKVQTSTYGNAIPIGWGRVRMAGNIIWADDIIEVRSSEKTGGKGGGGKRTVYNYFGNFAIGICEGPASSITRIWADRKLIYDRTGRSNIVRKYPGADLRFYMGTPTQAVDPLIEASLGVGKTSANRGVVSTVFEGLPLEDFGNRIPQIEFEIQFITPTSTVQTDLPAMFDWAIDWASSSNVSGLLYLVRRKDVDASANLQGLAIWDIFSETVIADTNNNPYVNEGIFGANGFVPWGGVFPGDDGRVFAVGRSQSGGRPAMVQVNPLTLDLIASWDLFEELGLTNNIMKRGDIVFTTKSLFGTETWQFMMFNGEAGGFPDIDNNVWVLFQRGLGDKKRFRIINPLTQNLPYPDPFNSTRFDFGPPSRGPVWGNSSSADSDGNLWVCGYMNNTIDNAKGILGNRSAKLWRVEVVVARAIQGEIQYDQKITEIDLAELDPTGRIHHPQLMCYDDASNTLTIWGNLDPDGDYGIVQFSIASGTIINSRYYTIAGGGAERELQPWQFATGAGASQVFHGKYAYWANGTNQEGHMIFPKASLLPTDPSGWTIYNARNFTFTFDQPGPSISGKMSQWYWYKELDWVYAWNGPSTDNPSNVNPVVFERQKLLAAAETLDVIVKELIADVNVQQSDLVTDAAMEATIVNGYVLGNQGRVRDAINPLGFSYFFDAVEANSKIEFRSRATASVRTIPMIDLGSKAGSDGQGDDDVIITTREQETEIPVRVDLTYIDADREHQEGNQHAKRTQNPTPTQQSNSVFSATLPIVMTAAQAKAIAEVKLYDSWTARLGHKFQLGPKHMDLEPTDIITIEVDEQPDSLTRVVQTQLGEAFTSRFESVVHDAEVFSTVGTGADASLISGVLVFQGPTEAFMLDIPFLQDTHAVAGFKSGYYVAMGGQRPTWTAGLILKSVGGIEGPFELFESSKGPHAWGFLEVALPALPDVYRQPSGGGTTERQEFNELFQRIDYENEIKVRVINDSALLSSTTESNLLETDINVAVIVDPQTKDRFEIFQFVNISMSGSIATLTGLLRGLRGTEPMAKFGFSRGMRIVFLNANVTTRRLLPIEDLNIARVYQIQTTRELVDSAQMQWLVAEGNDLRPLSGARVKATPLAGSRSASTITVTWEKRTRVGGEDGLRDVIVEIPLSEGSEKFEVDLIDEGAETVSITKTGITDAEFGGATFTVTERTTAGYTNDERVRMKIFQVSDNPLVGRGFARDVTL